MNTNNMIDQNTSHCLSVTELVAYVDHRLSKQQLAKINQHISHCQLCSEAVEGAHGLPHKNNLDYIVDSLQQEILSRTSASQSRKPGWKRYYAMAASLLLASALLVYLFASRPVNERIFSSYFKPYPNTIPILRGEEAADQLKHAMSEYEFENYKAAAAILRNLLQNDPENRAALFYAGIANLCLDEPDSAIFLLKKATIPGNEDNDYSSPAKWYLGLAYLKQGEIGTARKIFNELASEDSYYQQQSIEILELLKN